MQSIGKRILKISLANFKCENLKMCKFEKESYTLYLTLYPSDSTSNVVSDRVRDLPEQRNYGRESARNY